MTRSSKDLLAVLCLFLAIVFWGVPTVMLKYLTAYVDDGFTTNLIRYPVSTIFYVPLLVVAARRGLKLGSFWKWALLPAAVNIIGQTMFAIAPYYVPAGFMSFLLRISTIWSILIAFFLFPDERVLIGRPQFWLAAGIAFAGFVLMAIVGNKDFKFQISGVVLVLVCSIFWGLYDITVRYTMGSLHPLIVFGVIGNYTSIGLIALGPVGEPSSLKHLTAGLWVLMILSSFIGIGAAHALYYFSLQRLGVAVSSVAMLLSPFVTIIGSTIFLDEHFTFIQWAGGGLLITGAFLALWARLKARATAPEEEAAAIAAD